MKILSVLMLALLTGCASEPKKETWGAGYEFEDLTPREKSILEYQTTKHMCSASGMATYCGDLMGRGDRKWCWQKPRCIKRGV